MKRCPECTTLYEDHVTSCLVDGAELEVVEDASAEHLIQRTGQFSRQLVGDPSSLTADAVEEKPRRSLLPIVLLAFGLIGFLVVLGIVVIATTGAGQTVEPPKPEPVVVAPPPPPAPAPAPPPAPVAMDFTIVTEPPGADVTENDVHVCVTPCTVDHPEDAPLPRTFKVALDGYTSEQVVIRKAGGTNQLRLLKKSSPAPVRPRPRPRPDPTPTPTPAPTPSPALAEPVPAPTPAPGPRPTIGGNPDLKNPFKR